MQSQPPHSHTPRARLSATNTRPKRSVSEGKITDKGVRRSVTKRVSTPRLSFASDRPSTEKDYSKEAKDRRPPVTGQRLYPRKTTPHRLHPSSVTKRSSSLPQTTTTTDDDGWVTEIRVPLSARKAPTPTVHSVKENSTRRSDGITIISSVPRSGRSSLRSSSFSNSISLDNKMKEGVDYNEKPWLRPAPKGILKEKAKPKLNKRNVQFDEVNVRRTSLHPRGSDSSIAGVNRNTVIDRDLCINLDNVDVTALADSPSKGDRSSSTAAGSTVTSLRRVEPAVEWEGDSEYFNRQFGLPPNPPQRRSSSPVLFHPSPTSTATTAVPPPPLNITELTPPAAAVDSEDSPYSSPLLTRTEPNTEAPASTGKTSTSYVETLTATERRLLRALVVRNRSNPPSGGATPTPAPVSSNPSKASSSLATEEKAPVNPTAAASSQHRADRTSDQGDGSRAPAISSATTKKDSPLRSRHADPNVVEHVLQTLRSAPPRQPPKERAGFLVVSTRGGKRQTPKADDSNSPSTTDGDPNPTTVTVVKDTLPTAEEVKSPPTPYQLHTPPSRVKREIVLANPSHSHPSTNKTKEEREREKEKNFYEETKKAQLPLTKTLKLQTPRDIRTGKNEVSSPHPTLYSSPSNPIPNNNSTNRVRLSNSRNAPHSSTNPTTTATTPVVTSPPPKGKEAPSQVDRELLDTMTEAMPRKTAPLPTPRSTK